MATLLSLHDDMVAWVHGVLDELRPVVGDQEFAAWLVDGNRSKVMEIARMLQSRGDPRSATLQPTKYVHKTVNAFLTSVFYLKLSLAKNLGPIGPAAYLGREGGIRTFISCIQDAQAAYFATTKEERTAAALELGRFLATKQEHLLPIWYAIINGHSLLKPRIARRVALMHGTTKARWEREAQAF